MSIGREWEAGSENALQTVLATGGWVNSALRDANTNGFDFFTFKTSTDSNVLAHIPHLCGAPVTERTEKYNTEKNCQQTKLLTYLTPANQVVGG